MIIQPIYFSFDAEKEFWLQVSHRNEQKLNMAWEDCSVFSERIWHIWSKNTGEIHPVLCMELLLGKLFSD
jgi:hypothetical protein